MGHKTEAIFIQSKLNMEEESNLINSLGFEDYVFNSLVEFGEIDSRNRFGLYIGTYQNTSFVAFDGVYTAKRSIETMSETEKTINNLFPEKEFINIMNYESSNSYGFHYFKNGKTIRLKEGFYPDLAHDIGDELDIEKEEFTKIEENENETYFVINSSNSSNELEKYTHDQIGGSIAFSLPKLFTGVKFDSKEMYATKIKQFISKSFIEEVNLKFKNFPNNLDEQLSSDDLLPTEIYNNIVNSIRNLIINNGFVEIEKNYFQKQKEGLTYTIDLKPAKDGHFLVTPNFQYSLKSFRSEWLMSTFGRNQDLNDNKISNDIHISLEQLGIEDTFPKFMFSKEKYNFNELENAYKTRIENVILPYFNKFNSLEEVAEFHTSIVKVDFLLMSSNMIKAMEAFEDAVNKRSKFKKNDSFWTLEKKKKLAQEFNARARLVNSQLILNESDFEISDVPLNKIVDNPNTNTTNQTDKKPWWKIW
ncbi:MAG TPA: hypothetical protein VK169_05025 [Saprospiraceae bacterium]|nr:hypothetical protein [Saprospiraceae bacterium]